MKLRICFHFHLGGGGGGLLNLMRALKFSPVNKIHIFQCMRKVFCVEFQRYPNSTQNILPIHWKIWFLYNIEILRALRFKSSYVFETPPGDARSQSNSSHNIDLVLLKYSSLSTGWVKGNLIFYLYIHLLINTCDLLEPNIVSSRLFVKKIYNSKHIC